MDGYLQDDDMIRRVHALTRPGDENADVPDYVTDAANDSSKAAYMYIVSVLSGRGYSPQQIASWVAGPTYQIDIGLYFAAKKLKLDVDPAERGTSTSTLLDRRKELDDIDVTDAQGNLLQPALISGPVNGGMLKSPSRFLRRDGTFRVW